MRRLGDPLDVGRAGHAAHGWPVEKDPDHLCADVDREPVAGRYPAFFWVLLERFDPRCRLGVGDRGWTLFLLPWRVHRVPDRLLFMAASDHDLPRHIAGRPRDTAPYP